ncbi:MAG: Abi family protein [Campylobacterales bacterium]|nr:Abi family protein [Campylobacterales bacterium]
MKPTFNKPHLSFEAQVNLLRDRNLTINNFNYALKKLKHLNYYRLSAYFYPFYETKDHFRDGTKFEDIIQLYYFDKEFRNLIFYAIEKIEIYIRTQIAFVISQKHGVFGYNDQRIFHNANKHKEILQSIKKDIGRSKEPFVSEYFSKYRNEYLPTWAVVEIISFNTLSKIFANLKEEYREAILDEIDIKPYVFQRWLHSLTYIRNICAHHSRLWNKVLAIEPMKPKNQKFFKELNNKKIFSIVVMLEFLLQEIDDEEFDFQYQLRRLFHKYPIVDQKAMGFVENWEDFEVYSRR